MKPLNIYTSLIIILLSSCGYETTIKLTHSIEIDDVLSKNISNNQKIKSIKSIISKSKDSINELNNALDYDLDLLQQYASKMAKFKSEYRLKTSGSSNLYDEIFSKIAINNNRISIAKSALIKLSK